MYEKFLTYCLDMEDSHTELLSLKEDKGTAFFGVYDGHGGWCYYVPVGIAELSDYNCYNRCINTCANTPCSSD